MNLHVATVDLEHERSLHVHVPAAVVQVPVDLPVQQLYTMVMVLDLHACTVPVDLRISSRSS